MGTVPAFRAGSSCGGQSAAPGGRDVDHRPAGDAETAAAAASIGRGCADDRQKTVERAAHHFGRQNAGDTVETVDCAAHAAVGQDTVQPASVEKGSTEIPAATKNAGKSVQAVGRAAHAAGKQDGDGLGWNDTECRASSDGVQTGGCRIETGDCDDQGHRETGGCRIQTSSCNGSAYTGFETGNDGTQTGSQACDDGA